MLYEHMLKLPFVPAATVAVIVIKVLAISNQFLPFLDVEVIFK
jgi:hypothetical protein